MRPETLAGAPIERDQVRDDRGYEDAITDYERCRVRPGTRFDVHPRSMRSIDRGLPDGLAASRIECDDQILRSFAVHRIQRVARYQHGRVTVAKIPSPQ